jgi:hypothetical protein
MKFLILLLVLTFNSSLLLAQEDVSECSEIIVNETKFCFDPKAKSNTKEMMNDFESLFVLGLLDQENCLIEENKNADNEALVTRFIQKNLEGRVNVIAKTNPRTNQINLLYTNSEDRRFVNTALSSKDKWQIAGYSAAGIAIGALVSEKIYKGQADKRNHWQVGATVSGITTGMTYLLLETAGLGNKLKLSQKSKKNLIMFSGPVMGTVLGILKEAYDSKHRDKHTVDINDAAATSLGAGVGTFAINLIF